MIWFFKIPASLCTSKRITFMRSHYTLCIRIGIIICRTRIIFKSRKIRHQRSLCFSKTNVLISSFNHCFGYFVLIYCVVYYWWTVYSKIICHQLWWMYLFVVLESISFVSWVKNRAVGDFSKICASEVWFVSGFDFWKTWYLLCCFRTW